MTRKQQNDIPRIKGKSELTKLFFVDYITQTSVQLKTFELQQKLEQT